MTVTDYSKPFLYNGEWLKPEKDKKGDCKKCRFHNVGDCRYDLPVDMTEYCFWHCIIYRKI